jgi:hypothetical protein
LEHIFGRNGFAIDRATQSVWCGDVADLVRPLYQVMIENILQSHVICTDDTVMPMLAPEKTRKARMWVYVGDVYHPYNVFDFTLGRGRDGPAGFLKNYKQTLVADAYGGYDGIVVGNDITRAGCWAHARRKFVDVEKLHPAIAAEAVGIIKRLYVVEDRGKDMDVGQRLALRQSESVPILSKLKDRLFAWRDQLLPKHPMAEAVNYALNQWAELNVFAGDAAVPIDNNVSEREMKRIVLNRNYVHRQIMCSGVVVRLALTGCRERLGCRRRLGTLHNPNAFLPPIGQRKHHAPSYASAGGSLRTASRKFTRLGSYSVF